jgi:hypothetical protein
VEQSCAGNNNNSIGYCSRTVDREDSRKAKMKHWIRIHYAGQEGIVHTEFKLVADKLVEYLSAQRMGTRTVFFYPTLPRFFFVLKVKDLAKAYDLMDKMYLKLAERSTFAWS